MTTPHTTSHASHASQHGEGLFAAVKGVVATLLTHSQTRFELLGNELEVQKLQALRMLLLAQAMLFCATVGVLLVVGLIAFVLWEQRLGVFAVFGGLFLLAAVLCYRALMRMVDAPEPAFAATLAELKEDINRLKAATPTAKSHAKTPE